MTSGFFIPIENLPDDLEIVPFTEEQITALGVRLLGLPEQEPESDDGD